MSGELRKSIYRAKRSGATKVRVSTLIDERLYRSVLRLAIEKFGVQRGAMSYAVEEALAWWLAHASGAHIGAHNPRPTTQDVFKKVAADLKLDFDGYLPKSIPCNMMLDSIMRALGIKYRSAVEWLYKFYVEGLVKPLSPKMTPTKPWDVKKVRVWEIAAMAV